MSDNKKKKIVLISGTCPPMRCGVGDYTAQLGQALTSFIDEVHIVTSEQARYDEKLNQSGRLKIWPIVSKWNNTCLNVLKEKISTLQPDGIIFQWPTAAYGRSLWVNTIPVFLKKKFPTLPFVTTVHELRYFKPWTRYRVLPALKVSDKIVMVDGLDQPYFLKLYQNVKTKLVQIPIGSNIPAVSSDFNREAKRSELGYGGEDKVVVFFGFANRPKGLQLLFDTLRELAFECRELKFLFLSQLEESNVYHNQLQYEIDTTVLKKITLNPPYSSATTIAEMLSASDCAVLPFKDGVSMKRGTLLACMQQGLPIISTHPQYEGDNYLKHEHNILLVPPDDKDALKQTIIRVFEDASLRQSLKRGALELARKFDWQEIARIYARFF